MAARSSRSHNDTLTALIASLEILQATSNLIATVPFLSSIISGALGLAKTAEVRLYFPFIWTLYVLIDDWTYQSENQRG